MENNTGQSRWFLLRWNPEISSYTLDRYRADRRKFHNNFYGNWSVWDWRNADKGDRYVMMRVDNANPGIVWHGEFVSAPYEEESWRGDGKTIHYCDMSFLDCTAPTRKPLIKLEQLTEDMPEIDWMHGHSGEVIPEATAQKLEKLLDASLGIYID